MGALQRNRHLDVIGSACRPTLMVFGGMNQPVHEGTSEHDMKQGTATIERFGLPEDGDNEFDERVLEEAIRQNRRREFAELAQLNS
jgi:hypothetical protein